MKAMILAAGRGERMRPLTDTTPKPLLKLVDQCLLEYQIIALRDAGIKDIIINIAQHPQQFYDRIGDGSAYEVKITYSLEENGPLGTGGGIYQALPLLGDEPFIVVSADIWTEFPYETLLDCNIDAMHMVMVENPEYHTSGDYCLLDTGKLMTSDSNKAKLTYGNIAVMHPRIFQDQSKTKFHLAPIFERYIRKGSVTGELYNGVWENVGTPGQLERLREQLTLKSA